METKTKGIRYQSENFKSVQGLMGQVNVQTLRMAHKAQKQNKAKGIDGVTKREYEEHLEENLNTLVDRMKKFQYRPQPVRRVYIPKANGKQRPLGIPAYEDRLVQTAMNNVLGEVYEPRFLNCSYGFRPNRSAHDVVALINDTIMTKRINYVLEADIKGFFDHVSHDWLMKFLEHDIQDKNFLRYIKRFLKAGIMEGTVMSASEEGTPQGGQISPTLANVYLHYVLDLWMTKAIIPRMKGEAYYVRFADDFIILFEVISDAERVLSVLPKRLNKFSLELALDKTRICPIGRNDKDKNEFDFLGFTFYNAKTRTGKYRVGVRTSKKKLKVRKQEAKAWLKLQINRPVHETLKKLDTVLRGHYNYYGVNGNIRSLYKFYEFLCIATHRRLCRRSQRGYVVWERFRRMWKAAICRPKITKDIWHWIPKTV